jgi:hypothetical protein
MSEILHAITTELRYYDEKKRAKKRSTEMANSSARHFNFVSDTESESSDDSQSEEEVFTPLKGTKRQRKW